MVASKFLNPKNDVAFLRIFGTEKNKDILIHFINDVLKLSGDEAIQDVTFLSPIQEAEIAIKKQSIIDVLCKSEKGEQIIVEMQVSPQKGFQKRAIYYASKAYFRQLNKGKDIDGQYVNLKKVIFIAISDSILFKNKENYKSDHGLLDKNTYEHDLKDLHFTFLELPKFKIKDIDKLSNVLEKWCYFFKYADETSEEDLQKIIGSDLVIKRAYDELNQFNWTEEELNNYDRELKRILDNRAAEDAIFSLGQDKGKEEGRKEGKEEVVINMLKDGFDINTIAKITGLSSEQILEIKKNNKL